MNLQRILLCAILTLPLGGCSHNLSVLWGPLSPQTRHSVFKNHTASWTFSERGVEIPRVVPTRQPVVDGDDWGLVLSRAYIAYDGDPLGSGEIAVIFGIDGKDYRLAYFRDTVDSGFHLGLSNLLIAGDTSESSSHAIDIKVFDTDISDAETAQAILDGASKFSDLAGSYATAVNATLKAGKILVEASADADELMSFIIGFTEKQPMGYDRYYAAYDQLVLDCQPDDTELRIGSDHALYYWREYTEEEVNRLQTKLRAIQTLIDIEKSQIEAINVLSKSASTAKVAARLSTTVGAQRLANLAHMLKSLTAEEGRYELVDTGNWVVVELVRGESRTYEIARRKSLKEVLNVAENMDRERSQAQFWRDLSESVFKVHSQTQEIQPLRLRTNDAANTIKQKVSEFVAKAPTLEQEVIDDYMRNFRSFFPRSSLPIQLGKDAAALATLTEFVDNLPSTRGPRNGRWYLNSDIESGNDSPLSNQ